MIKNRRDGYHYNSPYWQNYKKNLLSDTQFQIAVGMVFGDATMGKRSPEAYIKFEQGYNVIFLPTEDAKLLVDLIKPWPSMLYKLPKVIGDVKG
jgi:hypothetical protein